MAAKHDFMACSVKINTQNGYFAKRQLIHCDDPSIEKWFETANKFATKDQEKELLTSSGWAIHAAKHCRNILDYKNDLQRARECLLWGAHGIAAIEIVRAGEVYELYSLHRAIEIKPELFQAIYLDLIAGKPTKKEDRRGARSHRVISRRACDCAFETDPEIPAKTKTIGSDVRN